MSISDLRRRLAALCRKAAASLDPSVPEPEIFRLQLILGQHHSAIRKLERRCRDTEAHLQSIHDALSPPR
ncbi:hypothetical protein BJF92_12060 [Rhizobium rhizosphaerae]|uniref:Uncharacterized protein n=1 Tax=Xaviernesmea rhizosphaerae TaxID=1672749 RepID=A0A1Q9AN29_9HYPH|nr:hypothetical protein BJF92_12060 [Xaviernesmea rhizosphaerae]